MKDEKEELWKNFATTGTVSDYLKYKAFSDSVLQKEGQNGAEDTGYSRKWNCSVGDGGWRG